MMAKEARLHSDMAHARQSDGINVIFDQKSPVSRCSRSRSRSSSSSSSSSSSRSSSSDSRCSPDASAHRGRVRYRRRNRSSSSSSRSSSPRSRSRSYPRCYRPSSRCRCDNHRRYGRSHHRRSPPRHYRARSRSYSRSPSYDRYSYRRYRSRSRSSSRWSRRHESQYRRRVSPRRNRSRSRSSEQSIRLSVHDKKQLLMAAKNNAEKILGVQKLELPESVKPILSEQMTESTRLSPEPVMRVRPNPEKTASQSDEEEPDNMSSPSLSPKRKMISFSINNSVAKPTVAAPSCAKVTPRVDSYESRKPYGHWIPIGQGRHSRARKQAKSQ